jgi:hypothetical protein
LSRQKSREWDVPVVTQQLPKDQAALADLSDRNPLERANFFDTEDGLRVRN